MAIFGLRVKDNLTRSHGQNAVASAAYIARDKLTDERTGEVKDFCRAKGLLFSGIYTPANAPEWAHDRGKLWNEVERIEGRKDSQLARPIQIDLPHELTDEQRRYLVQDFVRENFIRKGYAVDVALHAPDRDGDQRNYHAHLLIPLRLLDENGFAKTKKQEQEIYKNRSAYVEKLRESWEHLANRHLERHGHDARIDRRSLKDQGSDREPTQHVGPHATQLERDGKESDRGDLNRDIEARNSEREDLKEELKKTQEAQSREEQARQEARAAEQDRAKNADLGKAATDIRLAVQLSKAEELESALKERCLVLSQVSEQEAAAFEHDAEAAEKSNQPARRYHAGELVVLDEFGGIHRLTARTTGKTREEMEKYRAAIQREGLPNVEQGKKEAILLGQYKQRALFLAKQEQQKAELEKQQAERREQREKQAREFEEKAKQDIDGAVSSKHDSEQFRLEQTLKENHVGLFGRTTARIKQFIGYKLDEHRATQQKERLHKTLVENEQQASERDQRRTARQDKAHERGRATVEIKQAAAREKMGIHAPERDEALKEAEKVARRTEAEKGFRGVAEETTRETVSGLPTERAEERLAAWKHQPAPAKERHESTLDKTIGAARKGKKALGVVAREANKSIRVLDSATGISSGLNKGVVAILDGMTKPVEGIVEGIANLFSPPSTPPRPAPSARERLQRQAARKRATEQALSNIHQSLKEGNTINAADLQNLPRSQLERIRDGGDEYLQRLCLNWEMRQREERGRERER